MIPVNKTGIADPSSLLLFCCDIHVHVERGFIHGLVWEGGGREMCGWVGGWVSITQSTRKIYWKNEMNQSFCLLLWNLLIYSLIMSNNY